MFNYELIRTIGVVNQLSVGKQLALKDGHVLAMGEDLTIGFVLTQPDGSEMVSQLSELTLRQLNELLNEEGVGMPIA